MNQFLRIRGTAVQVFFGGLAAGFIVSILIPELGRAYFAFQLRQVEHLAMVQPRIVGNLWTTFTIFLRNSLIACLTAFLPLLQVYQTLAYRRKYPYKSGDHITKLKEETHLTLTMYSMSVLFAYGFLVFGLFLAHVFTQNSFQGLLRWLLYLMPHGIIESLAMIVAASTGIVIKENWLKDFHPTILSHWKQVPKRDYMILLVFLLFALFVSAVLEVYVSGNLMKFLNVIL